MTEKSLYKTEEVRELLKQDKLTLIDIRDPEQYEELHITGAVNIPDAFYYLSDSTPEGLNELHSTFQELFSRAGVTEDKTVIFYEDDLDSRYGGSCRGYWLMTYLGHPNSGILYGGFTIWVEEGLPSDTEKVITSSSEFSLNIRHHLMAGKQEVLDAIDDSSIILLDNRDRDEWVGKSSSPYGVDFAPRKGRIPDARWIEWREFLDKPLSYPAFKSAEDVCAICEKKGIFPDDDIIIYCFKGSRAANTYIALKEAGFNNVRIYFGSWNEWSRDENLPIDDRVIELKP